MGGSEKKSGKNGGSEFSRMFVKFLRFPSFPKFPRVSSSFFEFPQVSPSFHEFFDPEKYLDEILDCEICEENFNIELGELPLHHHCHRENDSEETRRQCMVNRTAEKFSLLRQKGVFFYDYFDDLKGHQSC